MKKHSSAGFLGSLLFHGVIALGIFTTIKNQDSANGFVGQTVDTYISMEMLMATTVETEAPAPEPEKQPEPEPIAKEEVEDPTLKEKPEPPKEKPKEEKKEKPKDKPKEKPKDKPKEKLEKKPVRTDVQKADRVIEGNAAINSQAKSTSANATSTNPNLTGTGASGSEIDAYRSALRREIERNKRYPQRAKMMRKQGIVQISFSLGNDGALNNPRIVSSSGNEDLDNAALQAVEQARSIGSPPAGMGRNITVPVSFKIQ